MTYSTLVNAATVQQNLDNPDWVIVDCRFSLADTNEGPKAYRFGHLPNARYAHLDKDLSSAITAFTGRHPLPYINLLSEKLGRWGIGNKTQVVVYDDAGGAFAARLWWLMRWLGHTRIAVLDGGIKYWRQQNFPITTELPRIRPASYRAYLDDSLRLTALDVQNELAKKSICLIDARTAIRYRGEQEPIDPIAGHIPGALNRPMQLNLDRNQLFLPGEILRNQFQQLIGAKPAQRVVHTCGSGVTACHNLLAMEHSGLTGSKLYAGSWSEWIKNKNRPVAVG